MTGIFDSIIDNIVGIDGAGNLIGSAIGAGIKSGKNTSVANKVADASYSSNNNVTPYKSKPLESVSPEAYEQIWLARLNKFANISNTPIKPR